MKKMLILILANLPLVACNSGSTNSGKLSNIQGSNLGQDSKDRVTIGSAVTMDGRPTIIMQAWQSLTKANGSDSGEIALIKGTSKSEKTVDYNLGAYTNVTSSTASVGFNIMSRIGMNATSQFGNGTGQGELSYSMGAINYKTYSLPFNEDPNSQNNINRADTTFVLERNLSGLQGAIKKLRELKGTPEFDKEVVNFKKNYGFGYVSTSKVGSTYGFKGIFSAKNSSDIFGIGAGINISPDIFGGLIAGSMSGGYSQSFDNRNWSAKTQSWSSPANAADKLLDKAEEKFYALVDNVISIIDLRDKVSDSIKTTTSLSPSIEDMKPDKNTIDEIKKNKTEQLIKTADYYISRDAENIRAAISQDKGMAKVKDLRSALLYNYSYYEKTVLLSSDIYNKFLTADVNANDYIKKKQSGDNDLSNSRPQSFSLYLTNNNKDSANLLHLLTQMTDAELNAKHDSYINMNKGKSDLLIASVEPHSHILNEVNQRSDNAEADYTILDYSYVSWDKLYPDVFSDSAVDDYARVMKLKSLINIKKYLAIYNYFISLRDIDNAAKNTLPISQEILQAADSSRGVIKQLTGVYNELTTDVFDNSETMGVSGYKGLSIDQFNKTIMALIHSSDLYKLNSSGIESSYIRAALRLYDTGLLSNSGISVSYSDNYHPEYFYDIFFRYVTDTPSKNIYIPRSFQKKQTFSQANNFSSESFIVGSMLPLISTQTSYSRSSNGDDIKGITFISLPKVGKNMTGKTTTFSLIGDTSDFPFMLSIPTDIKNTNKADILSSDGGKLGGYGLNVERFPCKQGGSVKQCNAIGANYYANIIDLNKNYGKYKNDSGLKGKKFNIYFIDPTLIPLVGITFGFTD